MSSAPFDAPAPDAPVPDAARVAALDGLAAADPVAAHDAEVALRWMLDDAPVRSLTRLRLQEFCWYELPFKWIVADDVRRDVVDAVARVLDLCGLARDAELCRGDVTRAVLDAWRRDPAEGYDAYRRASARSGVEPPDMDDLVWSDAMGPEEAAALWSTAAALEVALDAGELRPGRPGWRARQRAVAAAHLDTPRHELLGQTLRHAVATERVARWVDDPGYAESVSAARAELLAPVVNALLTPPRPPRRVAASMAVPLAVLEAVLEPPAGTAARGGGLRLSRAGTWPPAATVPAGREEADRALALLRRAGLVRRAGTRVVATPAGRAAAEGRELWRRVAATLAAGPSFDAAVAELVLAVLVTDVVVDRDELTAEVLVALTEAGWRRPGSGRPVPAGATRDSLAGLLDDLELLRAVRRRGANGSTLRLTASGRATALAALRARALAPVSPR